MSLVGCGDTKERVTVGQSADGAAFSVEDFLGDRQQASVAWTGEALFVYGGVEEGLAPGVAPPLGDAMLVDPATGDGEVLDPPPFEFPLEQNNALAVVDGQAVLVGNVCRTRLQDSIGQCEPGDLAAASYSLPSGGWQELELPTELEDATNGIASLVGTTTDGRVVLDLGPQGFREVESSPYWALDPTTGVWTQVPSSGVRVEDECIAGDELVVLTGSRANAGTVVASPMEESYAGVLVDPELRVLDLESAGPQWEATDPARGAAYVDWELACGGDFALLHDGIGQLARVSGLVEGSGWMTVPEVPERGNYSDAIWTGDLLLLITRDGIGYGFDATSDTWEQVEAPLSDEKAVWTGADLVALSPATESGIAVIEVSE